MDVKFNKDDKVVRAYWGDEGWTYVMRTSDGTEYHISRAAIIRNNYPLEQVEPKKKKKYTKHIYKNIYMD